MIAYGDISSNPSSLFTIQANFKFKFLSPSAKIFSNFLSKTPTTCFSTRAGLIYAPAKKRMFFSYGESQSFELIDGKHIKLDCSRDFQKNNIKFVSYSNKIKPEIEKIHKELNVKSFVRMKSSLKFCVIASGEYDGYVAEPRACEWDIAAGHAILAHAGGKVTDFNGNEVFYGKKDFKNPSLILKNKNIL